ncbi:hypothetical protein C8N46_10869 [Kordia periserrulae]|uniref:Uncharacterized protein n=1 Tax=Kordia periserrulae TaxID=701523 RepID=A0A2T6BUK3_9FLAO|nr:hypothetical protein [Kordia periserrulae]PTX59759.1 hypothetical protein C8N46_10869 [Kordia periserrulae]
MKIITISLSFLIFSQSVGFSVKDVLQIGDFFEHAQYHNEQYGDSLLEFISKHYGVLKTEHEQEHQEEREKHEKLPFQQTLQVGATAFILQSVEIQIKSIDFSELRDVQFHYLQSDSSLHSQKHLQPPRLS